MTGPNAALADQLAELAALLRAGKADRHRVRAYERAARLARAAPVDLTVLDEAELRGLEGIGPAIAGLVAGYARTGRVAGLEQLREAEPPGFGALLRLPLIGVRDARRLAGGHGLADVDGLRAAAESAGGLDELDPRLAERVRESLRRVAAVEDEGVPLPLARRHAQALAAACQALPGVGEVMVAGALRRGADTVDGLDLVLVAGCVPEAVEALAASRAVVRVLERRPDRLVALSPSGHRVGLWLTDEAGAGAALVAATGSAAHLTALRERAGSRGLELRPDGVWDGDRRVAGRSEREVYRALGLDLVAPELREGAGEVTAAGAGTLPRLVEAADLRGDLHVHSDWSGDGKDSMEATVAAASARGHRYVAITDHAENLAINGMTREDVRARRRAIAELQERHPQLRILDAAELNIDLDGAVDYDADLLYSFDLTVASVHSRMDQPARRQTDRILEAIAHPAVHVLGHPTGRIIGHRPGYQVDFDAVAQAAAETGTALEINGSPRRLDLDAQMARIAVRAGATLALSSDAHSVAELAYLDNAVPVARRGWATPSSVLNCRDLAGLLAFTAAKGE